MSQGNKRYLGDTFINADNRAIQEQFFRDIIDTYQGKNMGSFNALSLWDEDTQTEKFVRDFATAEQGQKAENALQQPVYFGRQSIVNTEQQQHIYTDAVWLDDEDASLIGASCQWYNSGTTDPYTLSQALINICGGVLDLKDLVNTKLDISVFNAFKNDEFYPFVHKFDDVLLTFTDADGHEKTLLNADLVGGIRFIVTTQAKYNTDYTADEKAYWRNFFIIKDPSEIPPDYADPMRLQLTDGYTFRVYDGYLQVSNGLNDQWKNICSLQTLLSGADFEDIIYEYITNSSNVFTVNKPSTINSIQQLSTSDIDGDASHYPFLSASLKDDFVHDITMNGAATGVTSSTSNGFKNVNLDVNTIIDNRVNTRFTGIENQLTGLTANPDGTIPTIQSDISSMSRDIDWLKTMTNEASTQRGALGTRITGVENSLLGTAQTVTSLSNEINNWERYYIQGLVLREDNNVNKTIKGRSYNMFNRKLGLGILRVNFNHYHSASSTNTDSWVEARFDNTHKFRSKYNNCMIWAPATGAIAGTSTVNPNIHFKIEGYESSNPEETRSIYVYVPSGVSKGFKHILGQIVYPISTNNIPASAMPDYSDYSG